MSVANEDRSSRAPRGDAGQGSPPSPADAPHPDARAITAASQRAARRRHPLTIPDRPLGQRVRAFVDMIATGASDDEAADATGMKRKRARLLILDPRVRALLAERLEVLRARERPRNLQALVGIRDDEALRGSAAGAKARIDAVRVLERMAEEDESSTHAGARGGGYRVDLSEEPADAVRVTVDYVRIGGYASNVSDRVPSARRNAGVVIDGEAIEAPADALGEGRPGGPERG